jgi:hypothetical protein
VSWSTVHTITCDSCRWWDDTSQGPTKAAATARAKAAGWLVEPKRQQLCPPCRRIAEAPVDVEPVPAPEPEPEAPPVVVTVEPVPDPPPQPVDPPTVEIAAVARTQLAAGGSRRRIHHIA